MNYTRRRVLRDAARVSFGLAASSSLPFLTTSRLWGSPTPGHFKPGIRIFFIGAWIFCKDPIATADGGEGMLAVTANFPDVCHRFPYGVWRGHRDFDLNPSLSANPTCPPSQTRNAHSVVIPKYTKNRKCSRDLFCDACQDATNNNNFNFFGYSDKKHEMCIDFTRNDIRVISLPIPTRMIVGDFVEKSYINNNDKTHPFHHRYSGDTGDDDHSYAVAAAHIFEYDDAAKLQFDDGLVIDHGSRCSHGDFHFHTVPVGHVCEDHTEKMLKNLISLISPLDSGCFSLYRTAQPSGALVPPVRGPFVPKSVDSSELALPLKREHATLDPDCGRIGKLASCAVSFGVSGPPQ